MIHVLYWDLIDKHHLYDNNTTHLKYNLIISYLYFMYLSIQWRTQDFSAVGQPNSLYCTKGTIGHSSGINPL